MPELTTLGEAVAELVHDGDAVALEGFTHLIPFAAGPEVLRQDRVDLELVRMTPAVLYDQMVGAGADVLVRRLQDRNAAPRAKRPMTTGSEITPGDR